MEDYVPKEKSPTFHLLHVMLMPYLQARAVITNAGQANAATGEGGYQDMIECVESLAKLLKVKPEEILVESTGVIGQRIKKEAFLSSLPTLVGSLSSSVEGADSAAVAITTTDLVSKSVAIETLVGGTKVRVGGMAKGSGMIHPNMATMLGVITTDARVTSDVWRKMVQVAVNRSFNQITVDGDTSTNDTIIALASGLSGLGCISSLDSDEAAQLQACLDAVNLIFYIVYHFIHHSFAVEQLNIMIYFYSYRKFTFLTSGQSSKVVQRLVGRADWWFASRNGLAVAKSIGQAWSVTEVNVAGADSEAEAAKVARSVAASSLVKSAVYGRDPNWGRIAAAAGYSGVAFHQNKLRVELGDILLMVGGEPQSFDRVAASNYLKKAGETHGTVRINISIGNGPGHGQAWGCDLSYDYVKINAEYTT
ncbi:hypothetical protein PIB30_076322 [Stylosanthes scabra]|uniref:Arginine biosynthesis bifunctional protein ArgJ, chloroplastic n=1 Tax=Stylosanthes scabra TaxID=79078 RepID=A0ABU6WQ27_9FABA|nr:hypothetical protein [Stylosanthes scabra]